MIADKAQERRTAVRETTNRLNDVLVEMDRAIVSAVLYEVPEATKPLRKAYLALLVAYEEFEKAGINSPVQRGNPYL